MTYYLTSSANGGPERIVGGHVAAGNRLLPSTTYESTEAANAAIADIRRIARGRDSWSHNSPTDYIVRELA